MLQNTELLDLLCSEVEEPQTHQKILGLYMGDYTLGVASGIQQKYAFLLCVEPSSEIVFPKTITIKGIELEVITNYTFAVIEPYLDE